MKFVPRRKTSDSRIHQAHSLTEAPSMGLRSFPKRLGQYREALLVGILALVALVTRAYGIWEWPITGDEYFTVAYAEERATGLLGSAYYALVLASKALFGDTKWAARLPSVVMGVLSVPAFYAMCRSLFNRQAAVVGSVFVVLSEWHLYHSQSARFYSGAFLFGALSYWFYCLSLEKRRYLYLALFFASALVAISFHATAVFIVASCGAHSVLEMIRNRGGETDTSVETANVAVCLVFSVVALPRFVKMIEAWGINYRGVGLSSMRTMLGVVENMSLAISVTFVLGIAYVYYRRRGKFALFALLTGIPLLSVFLFSVFLPPSRPRYLFYALPLFFALSAFACTETASEVSGPSVLKSGLTLVTCAVLMVGFVSYYAGRLSLDIKDPISFVEARADNGDEVIVFGPSAKYNFRSGGNVHAVASKAVWRKKVVPISKNKGKTWIIVDTYRTAPLPGDLEAWLMEHASLQWRKKEVRFDYTQRGYEVWVVDGRTVQPSSVHMRR